MPLRPLFAIPVKPFGVAKARLSPLLTAQERSRLGKAVARHTARVVQAAGADVAIVTASSSVARWARTLSLAVIEDPDAGLDAAAATAAAHAASRGAPWIVLHADLPLLTVADIAAVVTAIDTSAEVLAPSHDGGTSAIGVTDGPARFSYGPGSFVRHRRHMPGAAVVVRPGLAIDLDTVDDLARIRSLPAGKWVAAATAP